MARQKIDMNDGGKDRSCSTHDLFQEALLLHREGRLEDAKRIYTKIVRIDPENPDVLHMMGIAAFQAGEAAYAEDLLNKAVQLCPDRADFRCSLGSILKCSGKINDAVRMYEEAIRLKSGYAEACNNLGATLNDAGRHNEAVDYLLQALKIRSDYAEASYNLGNTYKELGEIDKAIEYYNQAVKYHYLPAYINLGTTLMDIGNEMDAIGYFNQAIKLQPNSTDAYNNLGSALTSQGNLKEAVFCYKKCLEINPNLHKTRSNLLLALHYTDSIPAEDLFLEHKKWADLHAPRQMSHMYLNDRNADKKIRIGYISPDFRSHPVAHFIEPILRSHDRERFDVYCYSDTAIPDHMTDRLRKHAGTWRDISCMTDKAVSDLILNDRIDILIDLAGHTANNRLLVFAQKPAPIQVTYLGYPDTTGLESIDYRIVDVLTDPPGMTEHLHTEELLRMHHGFLCYHPLEHTPEPGPLPVLTSGIVTFGCFNKRAKITEDAIATWSDILHSVPDSRMFLKFKNFLSHQEKSSIIELFTENNISPERIHILKPIVSLSEHIGMYRNIDIALDTFPYNGTTTTYEALWMGVPVITLKGTIHASRVGTSILSHSGLDDLIAESRSDYIKKAVRLAEDIDRLIVLRGGLRDLLRNSHLMDEKGFTSDLENMYRMIWQRWCHQDSASSGLEKLIERGESLFGSGQIKEAENVFRQALEIDPINATAMNNLGVISWHTGKIGEAREIFTQVLKIDPDFIAARQNLEEMTRFENREDQAGNEKKIRR